MKRAFTLLEILLVLGIAAIFIGAAAPFYSNFVNQSNLSTASDRLASTLRKAEGYAMTHKDDSNWQVNRTGNQIILVRSNDNQTFDRFDIPSSISLDISGGSWPIIFSKGLGQTTAVSLTLSDGTRNSIITVNNQGIISVD